MALEFIVSLALIVGISELKEWRSHKRDKESKKENDYLKHLLEEMDLSIKSIKSENESYLKMISTINEDIMAIKQSSEKSQLNTDTILKEYELNGIPMGYQRKQFDMVEGL